MTDQGQADADPLDELTQEMRALFERWEAKLGHRPAWFDAVLGTLQPPAAEAGQGL